MNCPFFISHPFAVFRDEHPAICELDRTGAAIYMRSCKCLNNQARCPHPELRDVELARRNRPVAGLVKAARRSE